MMADRGSALLLVGAAMGPARSCPSGFDAGFVQPMVEDGLGMCRSPAVRQQLVQPLVIRMQAQQKIAYVAPRLDPMALRTGEDRTQHRRAWPRGLTAQEEPIFSADGLVPKGPLAHVIVDRQTTIFRVTTQGRPLVSRITDRLRQTALGKNRPGQLRQVGLHLVQHGD